LLVVAVEFKFNVKSFGGLERDHHPTLTLTQRNDGGHVVVRCASAARRPGDHRPRALVHAQTQTSQGDRRSLLTAAGTASDGRPTADEQQLQIVLHYTRTPQQLPPDNYRNAR